MRTGIFGLKTKKDMQRSIDILLNVMQTDNIILRETKALLEYKDFEKNEVQNKANNNEQRIGSYKKAVAQLQQLNDGLKSDIEALESQKARYNFALFALITMVLILFVWARKKSS
jgi:chromosome segregation ATPase